LVKRTPVIQSVFLERKKENWFAACRGVFCLSGKLARGVSSSGVLLTGVGGSPVGFGFGFGFGFGVGSDMYGCGYSAFRFEAKGAVKAALASADNLQLSLQTGGLSQEEQALMQDLTQAHRCHDHHEEEAQSSGYRYTHTHTH